MNKSALTIERRSPLNQAMSLKKKTGGKSAFSVKDLSPALPLTSLIDAFCIIVIYLLIGTQSAGVESQTPGQLNLPTAESSASVDKEISTLRIENGQYFLDEKLISRQSLGEKLAELKKKSAEALELMVQADTKMEYAELDPLLRAGSEAGIDKLRFAVIPTK